jgi:hypothetical protein
VGIKFCKRKLRRNNAIMEKNTLAISKQTMKRPTIFCWVERIYVGTKPKDDETISFIIFYPIRFAQS